MSLLPFAVVAPGIRLTTTRLYSVRLQIINRLM
jgi:hypothetical protein